MRPSLQTTVTPVEDPPDRWVDVHDVLANPTAEEVAEGDRLGRTIDVDDDDDNGLGHR